MFELQSGVVVLRRRSPRRAGIVAAFLASLAVAPVAAAELEAAEMERLGRLSGEVLLHASVLKRLELNCPSEGGSKRPQDPGAELERDVQKMPEDFQAAFSLQLGATHKLGDFIVRDLLKKSGGCATDPVRQARTQAEDGLVKALRNWRAR